MRFRPTLDDRPAGLDRPGERDLVDAGVRGQRGAGVGLAGDDVEHALGQAGIEAQLGETQRRQRRLLGRLVYDRAAGRQRRPGLEHGVSSGPFHGVIAPTTPTGSLSV